MSTSTREALLVAARAEFAAHGLAGARVDRIAAAADCNKERIYAYFGKKDNLYDQVLLGAIEEIWTATAAQSADLGEFAGNVFDFHARNPELLRILTWESLQATAGGAIVEESARRDFYRTRAARLAELAGRPEDPERANAYLTVIGLAAWPHALPVLAHLVTDGATSTPEGLASLRAHIVRVARATLGP